MRVPVLLVAAILALGGCKSMSQTDTVLRDDGVDREKMSQVEHAAAHSGVRVHWVNPPLKPTK